MAVAKKQKKAEGGAPAWMVTYGDMVTLLLTFFVLLLSMSEIKQEERLMDFMEAIREAFGYQGGFNQSPITEAITKPTNVNLTEMLIIPVHTKDFSKSNDEGARGTRDKVRPIRNADRFVVGAPIRFGELAADLTEIEREAVRQVADELRGFNTQIEIRGHCNAKPVTGTQFIDHADLAYVRARRVRAALIEEGLDPRRLIVTAVGSNEPLAARAYRPEERNRNDIVELIQLDISVSDVWD